MDTNYTTIKEVAARTSISIRTLRSFIRQPNNPLPAYLIRRKLLFSLPEVDSWIRQHKVKIFNTKALVEKITTELKQKERSANGY
jgi:excisionase family DNA binding protein